jgi:hypothetical protein
MNDLRALVDDASPEAVPGFEEVLARQSQRNRRRRGLGAVAVAAALVVATSLAVQLGGSDGDESPAPQPPTDSTSPTPTLVTRPDPTYTWSDTPARVVLRTPERDIELTTWLGCWWDPAGDLDCVEEQPAPPDDLPDIGSPDHVDFWFGVKGWTFSATFIQLGAECARSEATRTVHTEGRWFRIDPAGLAGDYRVDLEGSGPHAEFKGVPTKMSFVWHTPVDGPVDPPTSRVSDSELEVHDLGVQPTSATAEVTITDATGETTTRRLPNAVGRCGERPLGELLFQGDFVDPAIPELGPGPYNYQVRLTLDGQTHVGTASDSRDPGSSASDVTWSPPLPAFTG